MHDGIPMHLRVTIPLQAYLLVCQDHSASPVSDWQDRAQTTVTTMDGGLGCGDIMSFPNGRKSCQR